MTGLVIDRKVWDGRANLEEIEATGSGEHFQGLTLFLYNPTSGQWSQRFAASTNGTLGEPLIGEFHDGRGEFYGQDLVDGKTVLSRAIWSDIRPNSYHFEEAFSEDGGATWKVTFVAQLTRLSEVPATGIVPGSGSSSTQDNVHGFDFNIGAWKTNIKRLPHPITAPDSWVTYTGAHVVRRIWNGWANLGQLEIDGATGHIELLSLRLYDPKSRQWNVYFANSRDGTLISPMFGEFKNGQGLFLSFDQMEGKTVLMRNIWSNIRQNSCHSEWAYSSDGGKTWVTDWIATDTRMN